MRRPALEHGSEIYELMVEVESSTELNGPTHPQTVTAAKSLAIAFWQAGEIEQAIDLLDRVLGRLGLSPPEQAMRADLLSTLAEIFFHQGHLDLAGDVQREVLELRLRELGPEDEKSLEAKGDLATVLFALGQDSEAVILEQEAYDAARFHLDKTHPVRCILAWNRARSQERRGDLEASIAILVNELVWLLGKEPSQLGGVENAIRILVSKRLGWDRPAVC